MSTLNDISNEQELRIVHDTQCGLVSVHHYDAYQNNDFTIHISTEDFTTMLKWYMYQKEKDENREAIQWSEEAQEFADRLVDEVVRIPLEDVLATATAAAKQVNQGKEDVVKDFVKE